MLWVIMIIILYSNLRDLANRYKNLNDKHLNQEQSMGKLLATLQKIIAGDSADAEEVEDNYRRL